MGDSVILSGETQVILLFIFPVIRLLKLLRYFESFRLLVAARLVVRKVDALWHGDFYDFLKPSEWDDPQVVTDLPRWERFLNFFFPPPHCY